MNKYEIYVNTNKLSEFIKDNNIEDKRKFSGHRDFEYVYWDKSNNIVNFFDKDGFIDGWSEKRFCLAVGESAKEVSPEEFLIAIGYIEKPESFKIPEIKPESIHYICEEDNHDRLSVAVVDPDKTYLKVGNSEGGYIKSVCLSPEGLIQLGSDLVKLGVQLRDSE